MGEAQITYRILTGKLHRKQPFKNLRYRCENIRMDFREIDLVCKLDSNTLQEDAIACSCYGLEGP
jgi:hypothetical protein